MKPAIIAAAFAVLVTASPAHAIDCDGRLSSQEEVICEDSDLRKMDRSLNRLYADALRAARRPGYIKMRQRAWLDDRRNCGRNERCLERAYLRRIGQLQRED